MAPFCDQGSFYFAPALKASSSVGGPLLWPEVSNDLGRGEQGPKGLPASGRALSTQTHKHMWPRKTQTRINKNTFSDTKEQHKCKWNRYCLIICEIYWIHRQTGLHLCCLNEVLDLYAFSQVLQGRTMPSKWWTSMWSLMVVRAPSFPHTPCSAGFF